MLLPQCGENTAYTGLKVSTPDIARMRGYFEAFQFLLTYLADSGYGVEHVRTDVEQAADRADEWIEWLQQNLEAAHSKHLSESEPEIVPFSDVYN